MARNLLKMPEKGKFQSTVATKTQETQRTVAEICISSVQPALQSLHPR